MQSLLIVKQAERRQFSKPQIREPQVKQPLVTMVQSPAAQKQVFPFRVIREESKLSQKALSKKLGIDRPRLVRLERKCWQDLCVSEIELLVRGLGLKWKDLLHRFKEPSNVSPSRSGLHQPCFAIDSGKGYRIQSLIENPKECFIGTVHISPKFSLGCDQVPIAPFVFYYVLQGEALVTVSGKEYFLHESESFLLDTAHPYEIFNPNQIRDTVAMIFSLPSFVHQL